MTTQTLPNLAPRPGHLRPSDATSRSATAGGVAADMVIIDSQIMERAARVIRVLGHPLRLRLLEVLEQGEHHVSELVDASGATQAMVSQHLAILRAEDVVGARRDGLRIYYRITEPKVHRILDCIRDCDLPELDEASVATALDLTGDG